MRSVLWARFFALGCAVWTYGSLYAGALADAWALKARLEGSVPARGLFRLDGRDERYGCALIPGKKGLFDGVLSFTDGTRTVRFSGFSASVHGCDVAGQKVRFETVSTASDEKTLTLRHELGVAGLEGVVTVEARVWAEEGVLRVQVLADRGLRISNLAIGPASEKLLRVYAGTGFVIERPLDFTLGAWDNVLTRHVGADYVNGLSVVQAVEAGPDRVMCRADRNLFAVVSPCGGICSFVPSSKGACAAARRFADVSGYAASASEKAVIGKMAFSVRGCSWAEGMTNRQSFAASGRTDFSLVHGPDSGAGLGAFFEVNSVQPFNWFKKGVHGEDVARVPWLDLVSHGVRVVAGNGRTNHYGEDEYLCATVMGGRSPLCDLSQPDCCRYVYDFLHDIMRDFAHESLESVTFGPSIHQIHVVFSGGCDVWVNTSSETCWQTPGWKLPPNGFFAKSPKHESGIVLWGGCRIRFSEKRVYNLL